MKGNTNRTFTPRVRFPEFQEPWDTQPLNSMADRVTTRNEDASIARVLTNSAEYGVLDQRDYFERDIATAGNVDNYFVVDEGDYVYNPRVSTIAPVGPISRNNVGKGVMSPLYTVFRFRGGETDFHEHFFRSTGWHSYLRSISSTGARHDRMSISTAAFMRMPLPSPTPAEQRKIAACLGSLDEWIGAEGRKLGALRSHKKGLMQQLFPRPGESRPRLRFPEFRDRGEWEERRLSDFVEERSEIASAKIPLFSLTIDGGVTEKTERYERSFLVTDESDAYKVVQPDDFAFNPMNLRFGAIARHSRKHPVSVSKYYNIFSCDGSVDTHFCHVYFRSDVMVALYDRIATGSLIEKRRVHFDRFLKLDIRFPNIVEQQRIATCLSSLDDLLAAQARKVEGLKTHKKALMQQLFPSVEDAKA